MASLMTAEDIVALIQDTIVNWHAENENRPADYEILTDEIKRIRPLNEHRDDLKMVVADLATINIEMWHEQDKIRSENDDVVFRAINNINPLNQHRNDLMEEMDEIFLDYVTGDGK